MEMLEVQRGLPGSQLLAGADGVDAVPVGIGLAPLAQELQEAELLVQGVHEGLPVHMVDTAGGGDHVGLRGQTGGDEDGGAGHHHGLSVFILRRGQKHMEQIGRIGAACHHQVHSGRETGPGLCGPLLMTDQKKTTGSAGDERRHQPGKQRAAHNPGQHQRPAVAGLIGIVRDENDRRSSCHTSSCLSEKDKAPQQGAPLVLYQYSR